VDDPVAQPINVSKQAIDIESLDVFIKFLLSIT